MKIRRLLSISLFLFSSLFLSSAYAGNKPWGYILDASKRFVVLPEFYNLAVLDRATGLVWTKLPREGTNVWSDAPHECYVHYIGSEINGRSGIAGWRLPTVEELMSLLEVKNACSNGNCGTSFVLPAGHPFELGDQGTFWSATPAKSDPGDPNIRAYAVSVDFLGAVKEATFEGFGVWCVRG